MKPDDVTKAVSGNKPGAAFSSVVFDKSLWRNRGCMKVPKYQIQKPKMSQKMLKDFVDVQGQVPEEIRHTDRMKWREKQYGTV